MPGAYGGCKFTDKLEKIHAMTSRTETSQHPEKRAVSRSTLILAIVMTVAWFALVSNRNHRFGKSQFSQCLRN